MANETVGTVACAHCKRPSDVRRYNNAKKKFYYFCGNCGLIMPNLQGGQEWILNHALLYGPEGPPAETPPPIVEVTPARDARAAPVTPKAEPTPAPSPPAKKPRKGFLDGVL